MTNLINKSLQSLCALFLCTNIFAQKNILDNLNSLLDKNSFSSSLLLVFDDNTHTKHAISSINLQYLEYGGTLVMDICYDLCYKTTIKFCPYACYITPGTWYYRDGDYYQGGNKKVVTIKPNKFDYGDVGKLEKDGKKQEFFSFEFQNEKEAYEFAFLLKSFYPNDYEEWFRQETENKKYENYTLEQLYDSIVKDLKEYQISSKQVRENEDLLQSKYFILQYAPPYLIISFSDVIKVSWAAAFVSSGKVSIKIPIRDARFDNPHRHSWFVNKEELEISSKSGIEITTNGVKNIEERYSLFMSEILCKELMSKLRVLKRRIIEEEFQGTLGVQQPRIPKNGDAKKISDKYVQ